MKRLLYIVIGGGLIAGTVSLLSKRSTGSQIETVASGRIHKLTFSGVTVRVDIKFKNPTNGKLKIRFPFIKLSHGDSIIGSSQTIPNVIEIPQHGEAVAKDISIEIPYTSLIFGAAGLIKEFQKGKDVKVQLTTKSAVLIALGKEIPYEKKEDLMLRKAA
jgi:hypothetical protein